MENAKLKAVNELREYDHIFLSPEGVERFARAFNVKLTPYRAYANQKEPKGLTLNDGAKSAMGMDAHYMAQAICRQLGVKYVEKHGRGSALRACCDALERHFDK